MKILGINGSFIYNNHDAAAALVIDGKLVSNYEEERFNRIKHSANKPFPEIAIQRILNENNLTIDDIDLIVIPHDPRDKEGYAKKLSKKLNASKIVPIVYESHHLAHVCDSLFQSGFNSAACLVVDGQGDQRDGITLAQYKNNKIDILKVYDFKSSLGILYSAAASSFLDLGEFGEGKLMGLSSYGIPDQPMPLYWDNNEIKCKYETSFFDNKLDLYENMHLSFFKKNCYPYKEYAFNKTNGILYYINFAASVQKCYNDIFLHLLKYLKQLTNEDNLIISGGCIQNCIGNNIAVESKLFKNVFAGPAPHDAGCAAGLAFYGAYISGEKINNVRLKNSYTGKTYTDTEILKACDGLKVEEYDVNKITKALSNGEVMAWFQGGSEIGPRALGHRSIIADPSNRKNLFIINDCIKDRENWRPLAPVIPSELFMDIFNITSTDLTEFMLRTVPIRKEYYKKLTAVCHVDYSTRPQYLEKEQNPELYELIMNFYNKTTIPGLINTSFNRRNEPIIETPEQAIRMLKAKSALSKIIFNAKYIVSM